MGSETSDLLARLDGQRPRAAEGLVTHRAELPDYPFDGDDGGEQLIFELLCPCGCDCFDVNAIAGEEPMPPVMLTCCGCATRRICFDAKCDGHDGVMGDAHAEPRPPSVSRIRLALDAPVWLRFEYPPDLFDPSTPEPGHGREVDLYRRFTVVVLDEQSNALRTVFDWECA